MPVGRIGSGAGSHRSRHILPAQYGAGERWRRCTTTSRRYAAFHCRERASRSLGRQSIIAKDMLAPREAQSRLSPESLGRGGAVASPRWDRLGLYYHTLPGGAERVAGLSLRRKTGPGAPAAVHADAQPGGVAVELAEVGGAEQLLPAERPKNWMAGWLSSWRPSWMIGHSCAICSTPRHSASACITFVTLIKRSTPSR